ncbi:MAG: TlpA disulfide reductase family protein [Rhodoferax sp.]|uniref:TlpA family protein disulfide reductase n=1 Tax=Rhodoferax sp. TaxID=50421 RepID=UPI0026088A80|nr:TlpA disulfide reductase family protein [Rhodoferax sp.]MDD2881305.1 TlpA disulfide reductase family protein [Rhodoferax sp.]
MMFMNATRLLLITLLGLAMATGVAAKTPGEVEVGSVLREATLRGLNGPDQKLSAFRGKPLVINVWASWCPPCIAEMGSLERLAWSDLGQQFTVIGISTDDYPDAAKGFLRKSSATINHYIDRQLELEHMLGATQLPLTLLIDAKGRVLSKTVGAREWDGPQAMALIRSTFRLGAPTPILLKK